MARLIYQEYLETWITQTQEEGGYVPSHVEKDFRKYLECGLLCHGFAVHDAPAVMNI